MVDALIHYGHSMEQIKKYTLRQVQGFLNLAGAREKQTYSALASIMRSVYHSDKAGFSSLLKELS